MFITKFCVYMICLRYCGAPRTSHPTNEVQCNFPINTIRRKRSFRHFFEVFEGRGKLLSKSFPHKTLLVLIFSVDLSLNLDRQTKEVDKSGSICLIINVILTEGCNFLGVE